MNVIENLKREMYIPLEPTPKEDIFDFDVSVNQTTGRRWQTKPSLALDKPSIMKCCHRRQKCSHTSPRRSPTMVTLHDTRFVECRWWNDGWTVKAVVTGRSSASMIPAPGKSPTGQRGSKAGLPVSWRTPYHLGTEVVCFD